MFFLEDLLTDSDLQKIRKVMDSDSVRFDILVAISGLDKTKDFTNSNLRNLNLCNADLRGFDFSNSDLRGCVRNAATLIDETTNFDKSLLDWISEESLPIVLKMQIISAATSSSVRRERLDELEAEYGRSNHIVRFLISAAKEAKSFDEIMDYFDYLPASIDESHLVDLKRHTRTLLAKRLNQSAARNKRAKPSIFSVDSILSRFEHSNDNLTARFRDALARSLQISRQRASLNGIAVVTPEDLFVAISDL